MKNTLDIIEIEGQIAPDELSEIEDIVKDTDRVHNIIEKMLCAKNKTHYIEDEFGKHLLFHDLDEDEVHLLMECTKPLGKDLAKKIIKDYFDWFQQDISEEDLDMFAYQTQNVGVYPLHRGLEMDSNRNKDSGGTSLETGPETIQSLARALNKLKRECGLHGELCKQCAIHKKRAKKEKWKKKRSHCHNSFCCRNFINAIPSP